MKFVRFETRRGRSSWGWMDPADPTLVREPVGPIATQSLQAHLTDGMDVLLAQAAAADTLGHELAELRLLAPVPTPSKFIAVGRNYRAHAAESGSQVPDEPMLFGIMPSAVNDPYGDVVLPTQSDQIDWEGELAVVIGKRARRVEQAQALNFIAGYTVINDFSARDLQRRDVQWSRAKSFDTFKPMGPCLTSVDELGLAEDLHLSVKVNGKQKQDARTSLMVFPVAVLIEYISAFCTLQPGDIIATGTPAGVGQGENPKSFLKAGDVVETEIDGIGRMVNRIVPPGTSAAANPAAEAKKEVGLARA